MSRNPNSQRLQVIQKQGIIQSLKVQLYGLKDKQHQFIPLQNEVTNVESKYELLQEEKDRIESEHRIKLEINRKNILQLRTESDATKMQIHKSSVRIEEILRQVAGLKRTCENKQSEIAALLGTNQEMSSRNEQLGEENRSQSVKIKNFKEDRNNMDGECERLLRVLEENVLLLKTLEKEARTTEAHNNKFKSILAVAEKDNIELSEEMRSREDIMETTYRKLDALNGEMDELREKTKRLEKECLKGDQDYFSVSQNLEQLLGRNKDNAKKIKICENELRLIENDYDASIMERDTLYTEHQGLSAENKGLNDEIDRVLLSIMESEKKSNELQGELQNYMALDEEARSLLNRREKTLGMLSSVNQRLTLTGENIAHLR